MAAKSPKFIDIKGPGQTVPSSTSRPIVVTNRPVLNNDPMMNPGDETDADKPADPAVRTAKTIKPLSAQEVETEHEKPEPETATAELTAGPEPAEASAAAEAEATSEPPEPTAEAPVETFTETAVPSTRDAAAESHASEAKAAADAEAEAARQAELESLISSGQYNVPINAVHRKRSRVIAVIVCVVVLLLAVAAADAALDAGLITVDGIPHTNLLKDK